MIDLANIGLLWPRSWHVSCNQLFVPEHARVSVTDLYMFISQLKRYCHRRVAGYEETFNGRFCMSSTDLNRPSGNAYARVPTDILWLCLRVTAGRNVSRALRSIINSDVNDCRGALLLRRVMLHEMSIRQQRLFCCFTVVTVEMLAVGRMFSTAFLCL